MRYQRTEYQQMHAILYSVFLVWVGAEMLLILLLFLEVSPTIIIPRGMRWFYLSALLVMTLVREIARVSHEAVPSYRVGQLLCAWSAFSLLLYLVSAFTKGEFHVPIETLENFWILISLYLGGHGVKLLLKAWRLRTARPARTAGRRKCA